MMDLRVKTARGIQWLVGNLKLTKRIQHPNIQKATDVREPYWFVRVFEPVVQKGGAVEEKRKKYILGPCQGPDAIGIREAELRRDTILARVNGLNKAPEKRGQDPQGDFILFERLAEMFRQGHLPTIGLAARVKYDCLIDKHLLPRFTGERLAAIDHHEVQTWINGIDLGWWSKVSLRSALGRIFDYAADNNLFLGRNPAKKVNVGRKKDLRSRKILDPVTMGKVLERVDPKRRTVLETALLNGMRVSEVLGLRWRVINFETGLFDIKERVFRGEVDVVKTPASERRGYLDAELVATYRALWEANGRPPGDAFVFDRGDGSGMPPTSEVVRCALKQAAAKLGVDFLGFGMHTLRRANITWRQSHTGATAIEASKMVGHTRVQMTAEYTQIADERMKETAGGLRSLWTPKPGPRLVPAKKKKGAA
jgi:integrase